MNFAFATCDRHRAFEFLKKLCPEIDIIKANDLLNLVEADEIRICDPDFHNGQIILGKNAKEDTIERTRLALEKSGIIFGEV